MQCGNLDFERAAPLTATIHVQVQGKNIMREVSNTTVLCEDSKRGLCLTILRSPNLQVSKKGPSALCQ